MKSVKAYRDCDGDIVYVYDGRVYPFTGSKPDISKAIQVKNYSGAFISHNLDHENIIKMVFPSGLEAAYVTEFEFEEES